ncbi:MAG: D-aminoacyl-tRNA deacylase, partial [Eubacteriales bacterium]|nr:D-aminoacyl-tRNA deacylase [Eubacteriales bacterium]
GKTNLDLASVDGEVLIVSQFTLFANTKKGNRPSFIGAASPEKGERLYEYFVELARRDVEVVQTGSFGAEMKINLVNDGPFTLWLDTDQF